MIRGLFNELIFDKRCYACAIELDYLFLRLTRNSAIADKPRDSFRGQSRSPNMVPFYVRYGFLLVSFSYFVGKMHRF